jgi:hypothetical protein
MDELRKNSSQVGKSMNMGGSGTLDEPMEEYGSWFAQCFVQSWEECTSESHHPFDL